MSEDENDMDTKLFYPTDKIITFNDNSYPVYNSLSYEEAIKYVKSGSYAMRLPFWDKDVIVFAVFPRKGSLINVPYLCIIHEDKRTPWIPSQIFNDDWQILDIAEYLDAFNIKQL